MRNGYSYTLINKITWLLLILATAFQLNAQTDINIGTGTSGNSGSTFPCPIQDWYEGSRAQFLYQGTELSAAGMGPGNIVSIKFNVLNLNAAGVTEKLVIRVGSTSAATLSSNSWDAFTGTPVETTPVDYQPVMGENTFTLPAPFTWNGTDNILIEICNGDPTNSSGIFYTHNAEIPWTTGLSFNGSHTYIADNGGSLCATNSTLNTGTQTTRPDIIFSWIPATACSGKPSGGTASSTAANVCLAQNFTLSLSGHTIASGITYRWQSSTNNSTWTDIPGATSPVYNTSQSVSSWYRAIVTCAGGGLSDTSTSVQVLSPALVSGTFAINSAQPTGGTNFQSYNDAVNYIKCGINGPVVFNVAPNSGPYAEQVTIPAVGGASVVNTITFNGNGTTVSYNTSDGNNRTAIILNGASHIIFDSVNVDVSAGAYGWGILLTNKADSNIIRRCTITTSTSSTTSNYAGILINGSANSLSTSGNNGNGNLVSGNTVIGGYYGIFLYGTIGSNNNGNIVENNNVRESYNGFIYIYGHNNIIVRGNDVSRPTRSGVTTTYGIYAAGTGMLIEKNRIHNMFDAATGSSSTAYCIYIAASGTSATPNKAENNLIYNINNGAGTEYGIYSASYAWWNFYHNTIVLDDAAATAGTTYGCYAYGANVNVKNNLIYITRGGSGTKYGVYFSTSGVTASANNDLYVNAPSGTNNTGYYNTAYSTLAAWQGAGFDLSSVSYDPLFVNATSANYKPSSAFVDNLGAAVGTATDITGAVRSSTTPDIGAFEFASLGCTSPPIPGTLNTTANPVCVGVNFTLSLTGGTAGAGQTYQWQSSPDNVVWTNINGATSPTYTTSQTTSTWYRVGVTCGASTVYSAAVQEITNAVAYATLPFTESFEDTWLNGCDTRDIPNNYWRSNPVTGNNSWRRNDDGTSAAWASTNGGYTPAASLGAYSARFHSYDASDGTSGQLDLYLNCNTGVATRRLRFDYNNTSGDDSLVVLLSTDGGITFTRLNGFTTTSGWQQQIINFTSASATTVLRFKAYADFGFSDIGFDNLNLFNLEDCSGTPAAGTTASSSTNICPGTPFTLSVTGLPLQNGLTYQWQSSPDNSTWTNITGATGETYTATQTVATWYRMLITCTNSSQSAGSTPVHVVMKAPVYAPLPYSESFENTWVNGCDTRDVPNSFWNNDPATGDNAWRRNDDGSAGGWAGNGGAYTPAAAHGTYSARFHSYDANSGDQGKFDLYIDAATAAANKRLTFSYINTSGGDTLAVYLSTDGGATFTRLDSVGLRSAWSTKTIFFNATSATTVIRFEATSDFGNSDIGLDDITVADWPDCSGTPNAGTTVTSSGTVCIEPFTLSVSGISTGNGITYQWQQSTDSLSWNNIPGATSLTLTTTQVGTHWYRLVTNCTISGTSANATPVKVISPSPVSGAFTINNALPTGGINFASFNDAYNYIRCGINGPVVFNVSAGTGVYNEQLIMTPVPGSSVINTVTFKGDGTAAIGFGSTNTNQRAVIKLNGASHIIFDSLIINANSGTYGYGVQFMSNTDSNVVRNCIINSSLTSTSQNFAGIVLNGTDAGAVTTGTVLSDYNIFSGNTIIGGYYGITLVASFDNGANGNNRIINNTIQDFYQYGIYVSGSYGTVIEKNTISRPARTPVTDFYGIYFTSEKNAGCQVSKNRITNPFGGAPTSTAAFYGINFNGSSGSTGGTFNENIISNNLIYNINGNGLEYAIANTGSSYAWYFHNTVSLDNITSTSTAATRGFYQTGTAGGLFFYNNIISITRGGAGAKHCIYLGGNLPAGVDNNDYYINAAAGSNSVGYFIANRTQLGDWKSFTALDNSSLSITPAFTDPANGNYTPGNAGIDNKGTGIGVTDDILDQPRVANTPDIGCYEFTPSPCSNPPVNGTVVITPDTICQYKPVYLHVNISAFGSGQTFQWQRAKVASGPFTNLGSPMLTPDTTIIADTTSFFRVAISCGVNTVYTDTIQLVVNPALPTGTYTINKTIPASYIPGTPGGNFVSFNDAKAAMGCGIGGPVVFNVVPGTGPYNEQVILDSIPGTSVTNTITFNGNGNALTYNATSSSQRAVLKLNGADHIIFDSLFIDASGGTYGYGVQLINNADSNTFRKCIINTSVTATNTNYAGIVINATDAGAISSGNTLCDGNVFDRDSITGGYYGVTLVGNTTTSGFVNNNQFTNNTVQEFYNYGLYITGTTNTVIAGNTFTRPVRTTTANNVYGIYITAAASDRLSISKNRFTSFFGGAAASTAAFYGIYHNTGATLEDTVSNNLFFNLDGNGPIYALYNSGSNNVWYYHNTISIDNTLSTATGVSVGFYHTSTATGLQFINNIITISRGGTGNKHGIYVNSTNSELISDYNDLYITATNGYTGYYTGNRATLADWNSATNDDAHSYNMNPLYTSAGTGNYMPQLVAIDNKGTPANIATDILNVVRSTTTPDIGAYEFAPPPCQNPPVAGTASVTPSSGLCLETPITLDVTGNSPLGAITFQWQSSPDGQNWTNISPVQYFPQYNTKATLSTYFRAAVTCSNSTSYTPPVQVTLNNILIAGTYTIDPALPATLPNFQSFQSAVDALLCGITGPVVFNVAAGTYNEQIRIPYIPNTSAINTVTFQSANSLAGSVNLTYDASSTANYTLKLDSTKYFIFKNLTISGTNTSFGRVVELANAASYDSLVNCIITAPAVTAASNNVAGIYANQLKGTSNVIRGNTISNGAMGIYFAGTSTTTGLTPDHVIDSNTISGAWQYGIYTSYVKHLQLNKNNITVSGTVNTPSYGIYANDCDSAYTITGNSVTVNNTTAMVYGLALVNCDSSVSKHGLVAGNTITAVTDNSGTLYGLYLSNSPGIEVRNNVVAINTSGASSYGLYHNNFSVANYCNNAINSTATSATNNYAAYVQNSGAAAILLRNNIFSHKGGGKALYINNTTQAYTSDYNMLYTTGSTLVQRAAPAGNYATLADWKAASYWDKYSIVYAPAFVNDSDLHPDLANPNVWAMHGRGVQIAGNDYDFNNNPRPVTLTTGVPDLGAYEFYPTALPTVLAATPATPAANQTQTFMYGTDTVMKITWGPTAPASVEARRFSGVVPSGLGSRPDSMYFYTKVDVPGGGNYDYNMELFYLDPWQGSIPDQAMLGLGKTTASNAWTVGFSSRVDVSRKKITQNPVNYIDRFTGLINPYAPPVLPEKDSSNRGTHFWVGYQRSYDFDPGSNSQDMVVYMSTTDQPANVQVRINGTNWIRNYVIPPYTTQASDFMPKAGLDDARLLDEGLYNRGISITSDVPITAYAHIFASANSGATMLFPVGVWGYEYYSINNRQNYSATGAYTTIMVVADKDNTVVEITPSVPTLGGRAANVPFTVTLNAGDVYQVLGAMISGSEGYDLTGSIIKSIPNANGECHPIGVFTGSSRTALGCGTSAGSSGDLFLQQNFPYSAWGKTYLTAPTSTSGSISSLMTNIYRVLVKDPATVVTRNNVVLTNLINNRYYQFESNTPDIIQADHPVMVVEYMSSEGSCPNTGGEGDPDSYILSSAEQAINGFSGFYRNNLSAIDMNYLTLILPDGGMSSLKIDGVPWNAIPATDKFSYPHSQPGYTVVVKKWPAGAGQSSVESDSAYLGLVYGLGSVESYGYNVGTMVKTLQGLGTISNTLNQGTSAATYTCAGTPFRFTGYLPFIPDFLTWKFSIVPGLSPHADVTVNNPVPTDSIYINGVKNYVFPLNQDYTFASPGVYTIEIDYSHPDIESCDHTGRDLIYVQVVPAPKSDFAVNFPGCVNGIAQFTGEATAQNGIAVNQWKWTFHDNSKGNGQQTSYTYNTPGTYNEELQSITADGCIGDTTKQVVVNPVPIVKVNPVSVCTGADTTLKIENPETGATYAWYATATGGAVLGTGSSLHITNITATTDYYVQQTSAAGCTSAITKVTITVQTTVQQPVVVVDSVAANLVRFKWNAVPGATGYQVSLDGGNNWQTPSSGSTGLTHTVAGLQPLQTVTLIVKAIGACASSLSVPVSQQVLPDGIFIPNSFTPNGDGLNDVLKVYSYKIREMQFAVFNQWGEKLFESRDQSRGWDGTYKGKMQPSGVYMYVCRMVLTDGTVVDKRGAINLIR